MMQNQQVPMTFQWYETKYMRSPIMARKLRKSLPGHLQMDEYGLDTICSLYYDMRRQQQPSTHGRPCGKSLTKYGRLFFKPAAWLHGARTA